MPGAGTKQQQISEPTPTIAPAAEAAITPSEVLSDFGQICVALPASGALIAVRDLSGLRCTVSFGNAPAVSSRLPTGSVFIRKVFETGEIALTEDADGFPKEIQAAVVTLGSSRSAIAVPILAQGSVIGLIAVFSSQLSAFSPAAIAGLHGVAKSFAALLIFDAANEGQPVIGGPLNSPIVLPRILEETQPPSSVSPAGQSTERPATLEIAEKPASGETIEKPPSREIPSPITARPTATTSVATKKPATLSQLPSDRPTPTRVWLIAAVLLLVLLLLALFLFESASHKQDASIGALNLSARISITEL